ncbi:hypothetical protein GQ53DRAFT_741725 [Thozetella sp. PMI_491]|nr:hypothetical protein GQ53DRAFT_741725 [Thozetella sp. PMI_491]
MLTINKPTQYGYRSVYDLPTPPSASRPSPPLIFQESAQKPLPSIPHAGSPTNQPMSAPHRGLPPPAAMTLAQPPPGSAVPQPSGPPPGAVAHSHPVQSQGFGLFPAAPSWHQEESMRTWLNAKAEEEKRRQEEEKTRQEGFRLEQRKMEHDILRTSLQGGIPPPMVPVVFAGMSGGVLPQAALEWAQQYLYSQAPHSQQPALLPPGPTSPDHQRRDSQAPAFPQYPGSSGIPSTPGSAQGPPSAYISGYPGSPTRPRGQSMPGQQLGRQSGNMPNINTSVPEGQRGIPPAHPGISSAQQQEPQPSPGIYFHHWQPPSSSGGRGSSDQPATPSGSSKIKARS